VLAAAGFGYFVFAVAAMPLLDKWIYYILLLGLFACCLAYQTNRLGASLRPEHEPGSAVIEDDAWLRAEATPAVTILIPSYREERRVLLMTMLSAALAQYGNRRIVLLVDDPPSGKDVLAQTLATVQEACDLLEVPMGRLAKEHAAWCGRRDNAVLVLERDRLVELYRAVALWLEQLGERLAGESEPEFAHVDTFFVDQVVLALARGYRRHADALALKTLSVEEIDREYGRLKSLFCSDISSFQRKQYANLSHAPNKAMNLNAYIGLIGGCYRFVARKGGVFLEEAEDGDADLVVPPTEFVLTLDADSIVRPSYVIELARVLAENPNFGVAQTPYRAFPNAKSVVERVAGATTDIQYLVHQGSTFFQAGYWVGANALIRYEALQDICRLQMEGGRAHRVYIQDETVIEDTGSTIDLLDSGWLVHNHFAPLAYSATPADFGSLAIQRQRWSNGGLIIFPMLWRQYLHNAAWGRRFLEFLLRSNYLLSPIVGNTAVFILMIWVSVDGRTLVWTPLAMLPYFLLYAFDLKRLGYRFGDVFAVSSLNLILLPVGFSGIFASIRQIVTGKKGAFSRTPKIAGRTAVHPVYIVFNLAMLALMLRYVVDGVLAGEYIASVIPGFNVALYSYGLTRFVGLRNGIFDLVYGTWLGLVGTIGALWNGIGMLLDGLGNIVRVTRLRPAGALFAFGLVVVSPDPMGALQALPDPVRYAQASMAPMIATLLVAHAGSAQAAQQEPPRFVVDPNREVTFLDGLSNYERSASLAPSLEAPGVPPVPDFPSVDWHPSLPSQDQARQTIWLKVDGQIVPFRGSIRFASSLQ